MVSTVTDFLRSEVHDATVFLVHCDQTRSQQQTEPEGDCQSPQDAALVQETQRFVDKCERWLVRVNANIPVDDPVFQDVSWLCGVAHDVLPHAIQEAKVGLKRFADDEHWNETACRRLRYVEALYRLIHDYIASLLTGAPLS